MGIDRRSAWPLAVCALLAQLAALARAGNLVPVMLWCGESSSSLVNPLHKTSRPEFESLLAERLAKAQPPMILFVKDNFCVEDIKHHKESLQQLNNAGSLAYLTSVESALAAFENLPSYNLTMEDDLDSVAEGQLALLQVNDLNAIPEIYNMLRESSPNLVVALTGKSCAYTSLERVKRANDAPTLPEKTLRINESGILFYADKNPIIMINDKQYQLDSPTHVAKISRNDTQEDLLMVFKGIADIDKIVLTARFINKDGYFYFPGIFYQSNGGPVNKTFLKSKSDIYFPHGFSYHCNINSSFTNTDNTQVSLRIVNLQVQTNTTVFDDAYDCIGFMSIPIWTGIFVTAILALIMIWGLTMIMDIRTMDRFDDPKGKTITISAQE